MKIARVLEGGPPVLLPLSRETCVGYVIVWRGMREGGLGECGVKGGLEEAPESEGESGYVGQRPGGSGVGERVCTVWRGFICRVRLRGAEGHGRLLGAEEGSFCLGGKVY